VPTDPRPGSGGRASRGRRPGCRRRWQPGERSRPAQSGARRRSWARTQVLEPMSTPTVARPLRFILHPSAGLSGESHRARTAGRSLAVAPSLAICPSPGRASVPALTRRGVAPLPHTARRGPHSLAMAPRLGWWAASCGVRCPLSSAWASCPGLVGHRARPDSLRPQYSLGGLGSSPKSQKKEWGILPRSCWVAAIRAAGIKRWVAALPARG
jgi:hypothetical protein